MAINRTVTTFPTGDRAFGEYVRSRAAAATTPDELAASCSDWYPAIRVVPRRDLPEMPGDDVWYVYRDASAFRNQGGDWWAAPGVAAVEFGRDGIFLGANEAAAELVGGDLVGRPLADVRPAEQTGDPDWLWRAIERFGTVTSVARLRRLDGVELEIEFHAAKSASARYVSHWRQLNVGGAGVPST